MLTALSLLLLEGLFKVVKLGQVPSQLGSHLLFLGLQSTNDLASGIVLVQRVRELFPRLLECLPQLVHFEHLCIPLRLQERQSRRETHCFKRFRRGDLGDL